MSKSKKKSNSEANKLEVFSFLIPMLGDNHLLMPTESIAEIVPFMNVSLFDNAETNKEWHIGNLAWRNRNIPVISLERIQGEEDIGDVRRSRIAVVNTLNANQEIPYLAFAVQGIPRMIPIDKDNSVLTKASGSDKGVAAWAKIDNKKALIPDMDALEAMANKIS